MPKDPTDKTLYITKHTKLLKDPTGRVAFDNFGSQKVLEKCGFVKIDSVNCFANTRGTEIEELIYKLT